MKSVRRINKEVFNNDMSREWKKYIRGLLKKYKFDDTVIFSLFQYCKGKGHLEQEYISVVAESWYKNNIIKGQDLDDFFIKCMEEERRLKRQKRKKSFK